MAAPLFSLRKGSKSSAVRSNDFSSSVSEVGITTDTWTGVSRRPFTLRSSLDLHETHSEVGFTIRENRAHHHPLLQQHPKSAIHHSHQQHHNIPVQESKQNRLHHHHHHLWNKHKILSSSMSTMDHHHNASNNHHNWASSRWENETVITANTSAHSGSFEIDLNLAGKSNNKKNLTPEELISLRCQQYSGSIVAGLVSVCAFLSPILMVILPSLSDEWRISECTSDCDALLMSFAFKLILLLIGTWLVFVKKPRANLPRIFLYRALVLALVSLLVISYWLFFVVRASERRFADMEIPYQNVLSSYSVPLLENLLWVHYLAVILMEVRHQQSRFHVKVVRSPDGVSKSFTLGQTCIQRAAVSVLDRYYADFAQYNPHLDEMFSMGSRKKGNNKSSNGNNNPAITSTIAERGSILGNGSNNMSGGLKYYEVDAGAINGNGSAGGTNANIAASEASTRFESHPSNNCRSSHGSRKREEQIERRKRRLISCTLNAFNRIRSADINSSPTSSATPLEIAQAVFPSIDRSLRKYLRATKQQYTQEAILKHLSLILTYGLSAHTFLEKYLSNYPVQNYDLKRQDVQTWDLFSDVQVNRSICDGTTIVLRQDEISLLVTFSSLPFFNLKEVVPDSKNNRFVLTINSESSV